MISDPAVEEPQPSITSAVERVVTSSQQLVVDRIDLVILEAKDVLTRAPSWNRSGGGSRSLFLQLPLRQCHGSIRKKVQESCRGRFN
jgi:hypothetical protein